MYRRRRQRGLKAAPAAMKGPMIRIPGPKESDMTDKVRQAMEKCWKR